MASDLFVSVGGSGPPLVLLHGTNSDHAMWRPLLPALQATRTTYAVDLPAHGRSAPSALTPPEFAEALARAFADWGLDRPSVVGFSVGGWTALELAKRGATRGVLAVVPAGLWRKRSPRLTDLNLRVTWHLGRLAGEAGERPLRRPAVRRMALRSVAHRADLAEAQDAIATARAARTSDHFPQHFAATRRLRFTGGSAIPADVPVTVLWGDRDRIALRTKSRWPDELPSHADIRTLDRCGHMVVWDRPEPLVEAALRLP